MNTYGSFAIEREETQKKINFIFICQKCFKCYNLFRFYINLFFIFFEVSSFSIAKLPYFEVVDVNEQTNDKGEQLKRYKVLDSEGKKCEAVYANDGSTENA